ncbi:hypothetical protein ColKHC_09229 [Colletotrichum higginsianum]|nr:hypothetical protein ColKHC_09229 [Colletotrichum higginsianum]
MLLEAGADVRAEGSRYKGARALHAAAEGGHVRVCEMLLDAGAEIEAGAGAGWRGAQTALQSAAARGMARS